MCTRSESAIMDPGWGLHHPQLVGLLGTLQNLFLGLLAEEKEY